MDRKSGTRVYAAGEKQMQPCLHMILHDIYVGMIFFVFSVHTRFYVLNPVCKIDTTFLVISFLRALLRVRATYTYHWKGIFNTFFPRRSLPF